jgi:hypothetical protein
VEVETGSFEPTPTAELMKNSGRGGFSTKRKKKRERTKSRLPFSVFILKNIDYLCDYFQTLITIDR